MSSSPGQAIAGGGVGLTPFQQALAQYTAGQQSLGSKQTFGGTGMGISTGETQGEAGALAAGALQASEESQANTAALQNLINKNFNQFAGGLGSALGGIGGKLGGGGGG